MKFSFVIVFIKLIQKMTSQSENIFENPFNAQEHAPNARRLYVFVIFPKYYIHCFSVFLKVRSQRTPTRWNFINLQLNSIKNLQNIFRRFDFLRNMIADETFPITELDEELYSPALTTDTTDAFDCTRTTDISSYPISSGSEGNDDLSSYYTSFDTSNRKLTLLPPGAPIKPPKISSSCQDLQQSHSFMIKNRQDYSHVESKVKKMIQSMSQEDARKRKVLLRHKSMPIALSQPPIDDTFSEEKDVSVLIKELRKKSVKIYELEEKFEEASSRIYAMEYDRSKMKMTFDKLRNEMHDLKEIEREYQQLMASSPPIKNFKHVSVQTDEIDFFKYIAASTRNFQHPVIRELTFNTENSMLNQTHFSDLNNVSSDNLIPAPEISLEDVNSTRTIEQPLTADDDDDENPKKKKKKFRSFMKLISCVSK
jgi:hypothetical protein